MQFSEPAIAYFLPGLRSIDKAVDFKAVDEDVLNEECWQFDDYH